MEEVTPNEIARRLGVTGLTFRNWLRAEKAARHPLLAGHEYRSRYRFTRAQADLLEAEYRASNGRGRPLGRPDVGSESASASPPARPQPARAAQPQPVAAGVAGRVADRGGGSQPTAPPRRQGYMADARKRKAVEDRAMGAARAHYEALGFAVEDVSGFSSFDLLGTRPDGTERHIEVKGTTGAGEAVELTIGEVNHAREHRKWMALFVLSGVALVDGPEGPVAIGGAPAVIDPWDVDAGTLTAKRFAYQPPSGA